SSAKPSALSSLLEFGTLPPSSLGDIRSSSGPTNPFPFPFVIFVSSLSFVLPFSVTSAFTFFFLLFTGGAGGGG
ncbi:unnamed protein product, partial [Adineta steineri]